MTIDQFNFAGKKAFVRVDFNVPLDENFNITDDTRMRAALPTLKKILADGGSIIIGSHLGRPKGPADKFSLKHILKHLEELLGIEVQFANDCMGCLLYTSRDMEGDFVPIFIWNKFHFLNIIAQITAKQTGNSGRN